MPFYALLDSNVALTVLRMSISTKLDTKLPWVLLKENVTPFYKDWLSSSRKKH